MNKIIHQIHHNRLSLRMTEQLLTDETILPVISAWRDDRGLDIVHYCILHNNVDVLTYLLCDTDVFTAHRHTPDVSPYAHLAATLGHAECLHVVLTYRPEDFFEITLPHQDIRLPEEKLNEETLRAALLREDKSNPRPPNLVLPDIKLKEKVSKLPRDFRYRESPATPISAFSKDSGKRRDSPATLSAFSKDSAGKRFVSFSPNSRSNDVLKKPHTTKSKSTNATEKSSVDQHVTGNTHSELTTKQSMSSEKYLSSIVDELRNCANSDMGSECIKHEVKEEKEDDGENEHNKEVRTSNGTSADSILDNLSVKWPQTSEPDSNSDQWGSQSGSIFKGKTPLTLAAEREHVTCVFVILDLLGDKPTRRFSTKSQTYHNNRLTQATRLPCPRTIRLLLKIGNLSYPFNVNTAKDLRQVVTAHRKSFSNMLELPHFEDYSCETRDYRQAIQVSIKEATPKCLTELLNFSQISRSQISHSPHQQDIYSSGDQPNYFFALYTASQSKDYKRHMLPAMTQALLTSDANNVNVNTETRPGTYPLYILIDSAFKVENMREFELYMKCLVLMLQHRANPWFDNVGWKKKSPKTRRTVVPAIKKNSSDQKTDPIVATQVTTEVHKYSSAMSCCIQNAARTILSRSVSREQAARDRKAQSGYLPLTMLKKSLDAIASNATRFYSGKKANTNKEGNLLNKVLFDYMAHAGLIGVRQDILECILNIGANLNWEKDGKYAINMFFDGLFQEIANENIQNSYSLFEEDIRELMPLCKRMSFHCLRAAHRVHVDEHLLKATTRTIHLSRYFCYLVDQVMKEHPDNDIFHWHL